MPSTRVCANDWVGFGFCRTLALLLAITSPIRSAAEQFPDRPITIVVGFGVGGSADRMTRAMSAHISDAIGQPVKVINKRGAGTLLAANYVLNQPHDGYTVFASAFTPYLPNTILEGNAEYGIEDFAYLNFQWFDEDLIALNKNSRFRDLTDLLGTIRNKPKTVRAAVVRGSGGHLATKLMLEVSGIPQENLNLVTYNSGGLARAAVAGHVVDFVAISAQGSESIREYVRPLAIVSSERNAVWDVPTLSEQLAQLGFDMPIMRGSIRGFGTSAQFKRRHPERFKKLAKAMENALRDPELAESLDKAFIGHRWTGPNASEQMMREAFEVSKKYAYLLSE